MARNLVRFDPFAELAAWERELFSRGLLPATRTSSPPVTDVYTVDDQEMTIETHLPGFAEEDVSVDIDQGAVIIQAEKREKEEKDKGGKKHKKQYVVRESSSSFYRRIALPEQADESAVSASFDHGVLRITVPFTELPAPRRIELTSAA